MRTAPILLLALLSLTAAGCMSDQNSNMAPATTTGASGTIDPNSETGEQNNPTRSADTAS